MKASHVGFDLEDDGREQVAKTPAENAGDVEDGDPGGARGGGGGVRQGGVDAQPESDGATTEAVQGGEEQVLCRKTLRNVDEVGCVRIVNSATQKKTLAK